MRQISCKRHRFPPDVIRYAVWLYYRFTMSIRDVEDLLAERGIDVTHETVRCWANKFGPAFAANIRKAHGRADNVWNLDEMVVRIGGERMFMWRTVDKEGEVLDVFVQTRRDKRAALKLLRKLVKNQGAPPEQIITDGLPSYGAALKALGCRNKHRPRRLRDKKPGREVSPSGPTTRTQDAALQVSGADPAFRLNPLRDLKHLRRPASPRPP